MSEDEQPSAIDNFIIFSFFFENKTTGEQKISKYNSNIICTLSLLRSWRKAFSEILKILVI